MLGFDDADQRQRNHMTAAAPHGHVVFVILADASRALLFDRHPGAWRDASRSGAAGARSGEGYRQDPAALNALLDGAKKQQSILDAISRPAEGKPWSEYRPIFLTPTSASMRHRVLSRASQSARESIGKQYGVAPEYIVAIVGVETFYGRVTGKYKVLDALVTLGCITRRAHRFSAVN
jgi:membrane-bound lytic murein transglycosylase B